MPPPGKGPPSASFVLLCTASPPWAQGHHHLPPNQVPPLVFESSTAASQGRWSSTCVRSDSKRDKVLGSLPWSGWKGPCAASPPSCFASDICDPQTPTRVSRPHPAASPISVYPDIPLICIHASRVLRAAPRLGARGTHTWLPDSHRPHAKKPKLRAQPRPRAQNPGDGRRAGTAARPSAHA